MSFPGGVTRYVLSGTLSGGTDRWSTGFYGAPLAAGVAQSAADGFDDAGSLTLAMLTGMRALMRTSDSITRLDVYTYGVGRTITDQGSAALALAGTGGGGGVHPNPVSLVLTLRTGTRSRRGRGRMYFVGTGITVGTDGLFAAAAVTSAVGAIGPALDNLAARVVSEAATASYEVVSVDADRVPDTQRGRSDALTSARSSYTFV